MAENANDWELSKENIQPLKQGRKVATLRAGLQPHTLEIKEEKHAFETELRTYSGDDPLDVWYRYVKWTEQMYPKGGKDGNLTALLERCLQQFKDEEHYKNDPRYVEAWIKFANFCDVPGDILSYMHDQAIGSSVAAFYEAWAWWLEQTGNTKKADAVYQLGIKQNASPVECLQRKHQEFQARVARHTVTNADENYVINDENDQRMALGQLRTSGKRQQVSNIRSGAQAPKGGIGGKMATVEPQVGQTFQIFSDDSHDPSKLPPQSGDWTHAPQKSQINKENEKKPGVWTKAKIPHKSGVVVPIHAVNSYSQPSFTVHVEENADQPMVTPRKMSEIGNQVLSARKPEKPRDPIVHMNNLNQENPLQRPAYCKEKIYTGAEEFSFEELRAARWMAKRKKAQEEREMEGRREELRRTQELLMEQAEQLRQQQCSLQQQRQEMMEQCRREMREHQEQLERERQLVLERQKQELEQDIQLRLQSQRNQILLTETSRQLSNVTSAPQDTLQSRDPGAQKQLVFEDPPSHGNTENIPPHVLEQLKEAQERTQTADQSQGNSNRTPSSRSFTENSLSGGLAGSRPCSGPTPDSFRRGSLTAPSPTVNTKEAMQVVMGMFNSSLDIDKQLGWGEEEMEARNTTPAKSARAPSPPSQSGLPFVIYDENQENQNSGPTKKAIDLGDQENRPPQDYQSAPRRKGLGGTLKPSLGIPVDTRQKQDSIFSEEPREEDDKMEGIESQARDDFTIAPVGSHSSFAAAAHFASTPFNHNKSGPTDMPQMFSLDNTDAENVKPSETQPDTSVPAYGRTDPQQSFDGSMKASYVKGLSPIIEGSSEESSSQGSTMGAQSAFQSTVSNHSRQVALSQHTLGIVQEVDLNHSSHVIDTTQYVPPELDEKTEALLSMSVHINPHNPFDAETVQQFLQTLPRPLHMHPNYVALNEELPEFDEDTLCQLGMEVYMMEQKIGEGGFARVYKCSNCDCDEVTSLTDSMGGMKYDALKVQTPPNYWEFYICSQVQERLSQLRDPVDVRPSMMDIKRGYFFNDGSCLATTFCKHGTLLDLMNKLKKNPELLGNSLEATATYLTIELLHMVENLHKCQIIHGDIKPDNLLVFNLPRLQESTNPSVVFGGRQRCLQLIDFGQSIDMTKYPAGTTFLAKVNTSGFQCIEMKTDMPWTYQTDLFGLAGTIHVILFGQYMKVYQEAGVWNTTTSFVRRWNVPMWKRLFYELLNVPSCDQLPDLASLRREFEEYFISRLIKEHQKNVVNILKLL